MKRLLYSAAVALLWTAVLPGVAHADDTLKRVQQSLRDQGFYYGTIDGSPGDETTQAIRRYQIRNGLQVNGQLTDETRAAILRNAGSTASVGNSGNAGKTATVTPSGTARPKSTPSVSATPRPAPTRNADSDSEGGFHRGASDTPPPLARATPGRSNPNAADPDDGLTYRPTTPRQPAADPGRSDLRVPPKRDDIAGPPADEPRAVPRNGIAPSASLTSLFAGTTYEFAPPPVQADILRHAQNKLLRQGFYDREPDGRPNALTTEALTNFQGFNHLKRTGRLDTATLAALRLLPGERGRIPGRNDDFGDAGPRRGPGAVYEGRVGR